MKGQHGNNLLKKTVSLVAVASASVLFCIPALAQTNTNTGSDNMQNGGGANGTNTIPRNTSPEVNREQNRPGTGSDSETRPNLTGDDESNTAEPNRIMQNRTGNQNYPSGTNNNNNSDTMMQNDTGTQNNPNPTNTSPGSGTNNKVNDANSNTDDSESGVIRGMW